MQETRRQGAGGNLAFASTVHFPQCPHASWMDVEPLQLGLSSVNALPVVAWSPGRGPGAQASHLWAVVTRTGATSVRPWMGDVPKSPYLGEKRNLWLEGSRKGELSWGRGRGGLLCVWGTCSVSVG